MEDVPAASEVLDVPAPAPAPEPATDAVTDVEPVAEPVAEPVVAPRDVDVEVAPPPSGPLDIKLSLPSAARKNIQEVGEETFRLTDGKQAHLVACLTAAFPMEEIQVSDDGKTIVVGDEHKLSFVVKDDSPFIMIHCLKDTNDHTNEFTLTVTLLNVLTQ